MSGDLSIDKITTNLSPAERLDIYSILKQEINNLISHNFEKLVSILYRIDVSEKKLRILLQENKTSDAAGIIADLIIERQLEKLRTRNQFNENPNIPEEDKW